jgi:methylase of polypeptide subunit release factors
VTALSIEGIGEVRVPREFEEIVRGAAGLVVREASERPSELFELLRGGRVVVLTGEWRYVDAVARYLQRRRAELVERSAVADLTNRFERQRAHEAAVRKAFARAMVIAQGSGLWRVTGHPDVAGIVEWLDPGQPELTAAPFLLPVRRLQRILTDQRRAAEGLHIRAIGGPITVLPHVFVPQDESVVNLLAERLRLRGNEAVLDMGTGTGVLALVAARAGAAKVIATDNSPYAVRNARLNVERLGLQDVVEVRGPADLFESVPGEQFDVILFNAPWVCGRPSTEYERAVYDEDFRALRGFVSQVGRHLREGGRVLLIYGDISERTGQGSLALLRELAEGNGLAIVGDDHVARRGRLLGARERVHLFELAKRPAAEMP